MIPKTIHQIWIGPLDPPTSLMNSWKIKHPDYKYILWDEDKIKREKFESGLNIVDLVVESKLLNSKSEVRRMIKNLGIKVNNKTIESDKITVLLSEFNNSVLKLSQGKKKHILIKLTP